MYIKQYYCCSICDTPYESEEQAFICNSEGVDSRYDNIVKGQSILFTEENYNENTHKIEKKYLVEGKLVGKVYSAGDKLHNVSLVVDCGTYIRYVILNKAGALFSYSAYKFPKSYLDNLNLK